MPKINIELNEKKKGFKVSSQNTIRYFDFVFILTFIYGSQGKLCFKQESFKS